ncbi:MAG: hypothetical protein HUU49_02850 [Candidatus Buchananbacteria bacterium]|nr:hypothetical protein [Candidatus Buchananbacteria bacterium]
MSFNWKRIIILIIFILTVILAGYLLYYLFLRPAVPTGPSGGGVGNVNTAPGGLPPTGTNVNIPIGGNINGSLPGTNVSTSSQAIPPQAPTTGPTPTEVANGGLTKSNQLTSVPAFQPTMTADGTGVIYYDKTTGLFNKIGSDGKTTALSEKVFFEVQNITWSPNRNKVVLEYPDGSNIVYDFQTGRQVSLPKHWKDFDFSPSGQQLVVKSMGDSEENRWLAVTNTDGSQAKKIEHLGDKDASVYPSWSPNNQVIAMYTEYKNFDQQNLYFLGQNDENFKSTIIEGRGLQTKWSTKGDKLLYSVDSSTSNNKPTLWIVDAQGENIGSNRQNLKIETWADKCTFADNATIYCAVPTSLPAAAGLFPDQADTSPTDIYKIDLATGLRSKIATPSGDANIDSLMVSQDGNYLYFTNKTDGRLYNLRLQ